MSVKEASSALFSFLPLGYEGKGVGVGGAGQGGRGGGNEALTTIL